MLNNPNLTNMSDRALAALVYSQVYAEENWFKDYNWVHPYYSRNDDPAHPWVNLLTKEGQTTLNLKRSGAVLYPALEAFYTSFIEKKDVVRLSGFGRGLGNQPFWQAWDAAMWFWEYLKRVSRYGEGYDPRAIESALENPFYEWVKAGSQLPVPFSTDLLDKQMLDAQQSVYWNTMRFVWAGARQREGAYPPGVRPEWYGPLPAIDYSLFSNTPGGRPKSEVSAFSLLSIVYSDETDVFNFIHADQAQVEMKKAIEVVERLGPNSPDREGQFRIWQPLAIELVTEYDLTPEERQQGKRADFLPYEKKEAIELVNTLIARGDSQFICSKTPLLRQAYEYYTGSKVPISCP